MGNIEKLYHTPGDTEGWLKIRNSLKDRVGGSELGAICGHSKYSSFLSKLSERVGLIKEKDISDKIAVVLGHHNESLCAEFFSKLSGKSVHNENCVILNKKFPHLKATIDRKISGERSGLECKTSFGRAMEQFEEGDFPQSYLDQCILYLAVTELDRWYLAILTGYEFKVFLMTRIQDEQKRWEELRVKYLYAPAAVRLRDWYREAKSKGSLEKVALNLKLNGLNDAKVGLIVNPDGIDSCVAAMEADGAVDNIDAVFKGLAAIYGLEEDAVEWIRDWSYIEAVYYLDDEEIESAEIRAAKFISCVKQVEAFMDGRKFKSELERITMLQSAVEQVIDPEDIDGSDATSEALEAIKPIAVPDSEVKLDPTAASTQELERLLKERQDASASESNAKKEKDRLTNLIIGMLKDVETTHVGQYKVTYKFGQRDTASVDRVEAYFALKGEQIPEGMIKRGERKRSVRVYEVSDKAKSAKKRITKI